MSEETTETTETPAKAPKAKAPETKIVKFFMTITGGFKRGEVHELPVDEANKYIKSQIAIEIADPENKLGS